MEHAPDGLVERQIREAMERGEFDRLPGQGRPIPGLDGFDDATWWARAYVERERRKQAAHAVAARVERALARVWLADNERAVQEQVEELNRQLEEANQPLSPADRVPLLNRERVLRTWHEMSRARR